MIHHQTLLFRPTAPLSSAPVHIVCHWKEKWKSQSLRRVWLFVTPRTVAHQAPLSMDSPCKNTGVGCHALLQGIFLTQRLNLGLLRGRQSLYCLSHKGSWFIKVACCWVTVTFAVAWKAQVLVGQSCLPLCDSMVCSPPGPSDHGILQAKIPEWVAIPISRACCQPGAWTLVPYVAGRFFILWATREAHYCCLFPANVGLGIKATMWISHYQMNISAWCLHQNSLKSGRCRHELFKGSNTLCFKTYLFYYLLTSVAFVHIEYLPHVIYKNSFTF